MGAVVGEHREERDEVRKCLLWIGLIGREPESVVGELA